MPRAQTHWLFASVILAAACADASAVTVDPSSQQLQLSSMPDASCTLRALGAERGGMQLHADHGGRLTFEVRRVPSQSARPLMELDCRGADGARDRQPIDLELLLQDTRFYAREPAEALRIRPALDGDLTTISQRELDRGGYPRRPNVAPDSDEYQRWVEAVTMPMRVLSFDGTPSGPKLDTETSGNWCGPIATSGPYEYVYGGWVEPHVSADDQIETEGSIWVGLGGHPSDTLIQAGTLQTLYAVDGFEFAQHTVVREVVTSQDKGSHMCSNCSLTDGDRVQFSASIENPDGNGNGTASLYYWNVTKAEMAAVEVPFQGNFTGATAEWIMEDPLRGGVTLPEFGSVVIDGMQTYGGATDYIDFGDSDSHEIILRVNDHDYCTSDVQGPTSVQIVRQPD